MLQKKTKKKHDPNWLQIPNHLQKISLVGGSGSGKAKSLFNLISLQPDTDKIYLYSKDPYETYELLINKRGSSGLKHFNDSKVITEYPYDNIYKNIEECSLNN